mmetsp:Transcript_4032/g.5561  ORF Transcript_4032/g.5561 Transcript_4032/m.5561 type:complete len:452 (+) Transcript_4032:69-1424(+)
MSVDESSTLLEGPSFLAGVFGPSVYKDVCASFDEVNWDDLIRREKTITQDDIKHLENCESKDLEVVLQSEDDGRKLVAVLQKIMGLTLDNEKPLYYSLNRLRKIIEHSPEKYSKLFLAHDGATIDHMYLMRVIRGAKNKSKEVASILLAVLYVNLNQGAESTPLISWACDMLAGGSGSSPEVGIAVNALSVCLRNEACREVFVKHGGVPLINKILRMQGGDSANAQLLYGLCFCLWSLSLTDEGKYNTEFAECGAVSTLVSQVAASQTEKVVRMALATLRNLSRGAINSFNEEMIACGLFKTLEKMKVRKWSDPDLMADSEELMAMLQRNYRDLTTLEAYTQEVKSGRLSWGGVHTERFWRENARATEADDFFLIRNLIGLLESDDKDVVAIACYDLGEFVRFYPTGKQILKHLNAKNKIMELVEDENAEVRKQALICISKIMVNKWEFVR